jgi:hypothetical protein
MKLVITIDTEEDNWGGFGLTDYSLDNIKRIPVLQDLFDEFDVRPTYLITYPVATDERAILILRDILDRDGCEIGTHCHPWTTPPLAEETNERNSMLCNLPSALQYQKLASLLNVIKENFGVQPVSFRAGRFGYNNNVSRNLYAQGYKIDSSISPYTDWTSYHGPDFSNISPKPFRFSPENAFQNLSDGDMMEIPPTIAFFQKNFHLCAHILQILSRKAMRSLRLIGVLSKFNLLNKTWLNPEMSNSTQMIRLTKSMILNDYHILNMMFHSTSLKAGLSPFIKTKDDEKRFFQHLREYLIFTRDNNIEPLTLSGASQLI